MDGAQAPLHRFHPTTGLFLGYAGLGVCGATVLVVAIGYHTVPGLRLALGAALLGVVVWVTQLRPRAAAYPTELELRNALRDTRVPYVLIDEVSIGQTLNVWVGERRYVCIGIGGSVRADLVARRRESRDAAVAMRTDRDVVASYRTFILTTLEELIGREKRRRERSDQPRDPGEVRQRLAVPELVSLVGLAAMLVASLLV